MMTKRNLGLGAALALLVGLAVGCDPGWTNPVVGSGDGSGSVPGDPPGVAAAGVALGSPWALTDLGSRGYLVYDGANCTIMRVAGGTATRYAGNGTCGDSGDGGPASAAEIEVVATPLGGGLQADPGGNVYFVGTGPGGTSVVRRIDAASGDISTLTALDGVPVYGLAPEADGRLVYATSVELDDGTGTGFTVQLRQLDRTGADTLVASLPTALRASGFARVGPDHYVLPGGTDGENLRLDVDDGIVSMLPVGTDDDVIYETAGSDGSVYGITWNSETGLDGNHVIRIRPDGSVDFIAGSGDPDPATKRQMGTGAHLDLTAYAVAMTGQGNLLIGSGHTVYDLVAAATAPAISAP
jgi:hypothetical protein